MLLKVVHYGNRIATLCGKSGKRSLNVPNVTCLDCLRMYKVGTADKARSTFQAIGISVNTDKNEN
jgi:hypothetical protein